MENITFSWLLIVTLMIFPLSSRSQDNDGDGINDQLETKLALRFAPEWRFHKAIPGSSSNQNHDEIHFPSSIEWMHNYVLQETGKPPNLEYIPTGAKSPITNIDKLDLMIVPGTSKNASDPYWGKCDNGNIRITDFPEKISGDRYGFPTYFHCYNLGNGQVSIGYLLYYPMDYKGSYCVFPGWFGGCWWSVELGKHRSDWEGVNVVISNVKDLNDPLSAENAVLERVKFSGHGSKKYINSSSSRFRSVNETHPKVYISWGSHTTYPEPGRFNNYKVWEFCVSLEPLICVNTNWYDDLFYGNGIVVQSWSSSRKLVNLGEENKPMVGWLNYKGWWGPDDNGANSSPPGPPCKSPWSSSIEGYVTWEEAIKYDEYSQYWEDGFELDCSPEYAAFYIPDPHYDCSMVVDDRIKCPTDLFLFPVGTISEGLDWTLLNGKLCIFPGRYSENIIFTKPMKVEAPEGIVVIGK